MSNGVREKPSPAGTVATVVVAGAFGRCAIAFEQAIAAINAAKGTHCFKRGVVLEIGDADADMVMRGKAGGTRSSAIDAPVDTKARIGASLPKEL